MATQRLTCLQGEAKARCKWSNWKWQCHLPTPTSLVATWKNLAATLTLRDENGSFQATLNHAGLAINRDKKELEGSPILLDSRYEGKDNEGKAIRINSTLSATVKARLKSDLSPQHLTIAPLSISGTATLPALVKPLPINFQGKVSIESMKSLAIDINGAVAESQMALQASVPNLRAKTIDPAVTLSVDKFDLDAWFPPDLTPHKAENKVSNDKMISATGSVASPAPPPDIPLDFSALQGLAGNIRVNIGEVLARGLKITALKLTLDSDGKVMQLNPVALNIAGGSLIGRVQLEPATQKVAVVADLQRINAGDLLQDLKITDIVRGKANINLDIATQGKSLNAFKAQINGKVNMLITDGGVKGFNLARSLRKAMAAFGKKR
jgi:uncharacterized protein involved in outer membrane biogenesis